MKIILASASPRRRELMDLAKFDYEVLVSNYDEKVDLTLTLEEQSKELAYGKAKDVFENIASYNFSQMRYLSRGYESGTADVYINGIRFNDALSGYSPYSLFSGLNEATREKESVTGLAISDYGIGGINGITNVSASASKVAKGYRFSVLTNSTTYRLRLMATYATGEMDNGWAFAASVSTRLGGNDYVTGVYYNALAYFLVVSKSLPMKNIS